MMNEIRIDALLPGYSIEVHGGIDVYLWPALDPRVEGLSRFQREELERKKESEFAEQTAFMVKKRPTVELNHSFACFQYDPKKGLFTYRDGSRIPDASALEDLAQSPMRKRADRLGHRVIGCDTDPEGDDRLRAREYSGHALKYRSEAPPLMIIQEQHCRPDSHFLRLLEGSRVSYGIIRKRQSVAALRR